VININTIKGKSLLESPAEFVDLIGEGGKGYLIVQRGGAAHADTVPDDTGVIARKRGTDS